MREKNIGWAIKQLREAKGWTQGELADLVGTDAGNISRIEGGTQWVRKEVLEGLSDALEIPISKIFEMAEKPKKRDEIVINYGDKQLAELAKVYLALDGDKRKQALRLLQALKE